MKSQVGGEPAVISPITRPVSRVIEPDVVYWCSTFRPYRWLNAVIRRSASALLKVLAPFNWKPVSFAAAAFSASTAPAVVGAACPPGAPAPLAAGLPAPGLGPDAAPLPHAARTPS